MADNNDRVTTTVIGYRDAHYQGEPKSRREIHRLDEPLSLKSPPKITNQSLYGGMKNP